MAKKEPREPNFTIVGAVAAALIVVGYVFLIRTSASFREAPKAELLREQTEQAKSLQQR
jgi:hypothetical protein